MPSRDQALSPETMVESITENFTQVSQRYGGCVGCLEKWNTEELRQQEPIARLR